MFIVTFNGSASMRLSAKYRPVPDQIRHDLGLLDGTEDVAYSIWYVPDDAGWPDGPGYNDDDHGDEYLQSAGTAERMSVEVRRLEADGEYRLYAVGRPGDDPSAPDETIAYATNELTVRPTETFDADEAAAIYLCYFETRAVPDSYVLRPLDI